MTESTAEVRKAAPRAASEFQRARWIAAGITTLSCAVVLAPMFTQNPKDSYPLSTYPMFAEKRGTPKVHQLVGVDAAGERTPVPPKLLGTSEVLQSKVLIRHAVSGGRAARRKLCKEVAARVARDPEYAEWRSIELVAARFNAIDYLITEPKPLSRRRLYHCKVRQGDS